VYKTVDQWNSSFVQIIYSPSDPLGGNPAAFLAPFILCHSNTNVLYAGGTTLWKTTNANTFNAVQPDPVDNGNFVLSIAASTTSTDTVYFATAPTDSYPMHVYRSDDGGFAKTDISAGLPNRYPRRIAVNPNNCKEVYVIFSGFGSGHIFKSEDAGASWTDISTALLICRFTAWPSILCSRKIFMQAAILRYILPSMADKHGQLLQMPYLKRCRFLTL
jgi:hypothetical protein